jgi:hypothetical protein
MNCLEGSDLVKVVISLRNFFGGIAVLFFSECFVSIERLGHAGYLMISVLIYVVHAPYCETVSTKGLETFNPGKVTFYVIIDFAETINGDVPSQKDQMYMNVQLDGKRMVFVLSSKIMI